VFFVVRTGAPSPCSPVTQSTHSALFSGHKKFTQWVHIQKRLWNTRSLCYAISNDGWPEGSGQCAPTHRHNETMLCPRATHSSDKRVEARRRHAITNLISRRLRCRNLDGTRGKEDRQRVHVQSVYECIPSGHYAFFIACCISSYTPNRWYEWCVGAVIRNSEAHGGLTELRSQSSTTTSIQARIIQNN
jgi:hypothetical protein